MVWRILLTVFLGISCLTCLLKNVNIFGRSSKGTDAIDIGFVVATTLYGWLWRATCIVGIWMI